MSTKAAKPLSERAQKKRDAETVARLEALAAPIRDTCLNMEYTEADLPALQERVKCLELQLKQLENACLCMWNDGHEGFDNIYNLKGQVEPFKNCFSFKTKNPRVLNLAMEECKLLMEIAFIGAYLNGF